MVGKREGRMVMLTQYLTGSKMNIDQTMIKSLGCHVDDSDDSEGCVSVESAMPTDDRQGVDDVGIGEQTLGESDKALDYLVGITAKYIRMSTEASIASFGRGNQDFPVLLMPGADPRGKQAASSFGCHTFSDSAS